MVNKLKVLLVNPRCLDRRILGHDARVVPIGLYYIGALLIENGFAVHILNLADVETDAISVFQEKASGFQPDVIGFSITNPNRWNAVECAQLARQLLPDAIVVFGGPCATFMAEHLFDVCPNLDFIIPGEGERSFLELVKALADNIPPDEKQVKGIIYKKGNEILKTPERPLMSDLDQLPHPSGHFTFQHLAMSRGCPGNCTFCGSPKFWLKRHVRFHSARWIADEIEALHQKGVTHFYISDDTFTMDKPRVIELCRLIREKKLAITWNAISRVDYIDEELLFAMRTAGCIQISFGVESGSEKIRKTLGKPILEKTIIQAFDLTRSFGIMPRAYFIYGSPGETKQTINDSIVLLHRIKPLGAVFYMLVIFPGTFLYRSALQKGLVSDDLWHKRIEDIPWFEVDTDLDFEMVKAFGDSLREEFYQHLSQFARDITLVDNRALYPWHADFLSRLAMTFSHGEYASDPRVKHTDETAMDLYRLALKYAPDPRAYLGLGMLLQKKRKFEEAINYLEKSLEKYPDHPDLNICLGVCLMNLKRFSKALAIFESLDQMEQTRHYIAICRQQISGQK